MVQTVMASAGHDTWFIIAQNYAFGKAQVADLHKEVEAKGGKIVGEILHPIGLQDYSSFLLQAQASGANVIAIGDVGGDQANVLKQAKEFGLDKGSAQVVAVGSSNLPDMEALGVEAAGGVLFVSTFEWSRTPGARAWTQRFVDKMGRFPSQGGRLLSGPSLPAGRERYGNGRLDDGDDAHKRDARARHFRRERPPS
jgi:branched-chain amino acid transport system substrate-binding protein